MSIFFGFSEELFGKLLLSVFDFHWTCPVRVLLFFGISPAFSIKFCCFVSLLLVVVISGLDKNNSCTSSHFPIQ